MTDRERLELAAKAAGIDTKRCLQYEDGAFDWPVKAGRWNPLTDDGDALRLAVRLRLCMNPADGGFRAWRLMPGHHEAYRDHDGDEMEATRRAIVRAAAEIGRQMK